MEQRPPKLDSLQGLLKFAIQNTKSEDAPNESAYESMDPERKKFLENALQCYSVDLMKELEKGVNLLDSKDSSTEEKLHSLEMIEELTGSIDLSNGFLKIGGSRILMNCLDSSDPKIRSASAKIIGEIAQNNPYAQQHFIDVDTIPKLVTLLSETDNNVVRNTLHAVSCSVRNYEPALAVFVEKHGLEEIIKSLSQSDIDDRTFTKASFLIGTLSSEFAVVRDQFLKLEVVKMLSMLAISSIENYNGEYDSKIENTLSALNILTEDGKGKAQLKEVHNLESSLKKLIGLCQNEQECEEMIQYSRNLLNIFA